MRSCHCLNVLVESESADFPQIPIESLGLSEEELKDGFFKQSLQKVEKLVSIQKAVPQLIQSKSVGSWTVDKCINCNTETHAVHRDKGASCVLISSNLMSADAISKLKSSGLLSTFYNIVVNPHDVEADDDSPIDTYRLPQEVRQSIKSLSRVCNDFILEEAGAVQKRIKQFQEEQYKQLHALNDRALQEQQSLARVIKSTMKPDTISDSTKSSWNPIQDGNKSQRLMEPLSPGKYAQNKPHTPIAKFAPKRQKSTPTPHTTSFDAEGLFDCEGLDDNTSVTASDVEDSDRDEKEEGVRIPRNRSGSISIAKSLPVNIPPFMQQARFKDGGPDDELEEVLPQNPMEIAANIQALAKSVHGDTVFGDLPRPRFSTQY